MYKVWVETYSGKVWSYLRSFKTWKEASKYVSECRYDDLYAYNAISKYKIIKTLNN